MPSSMLSLNIYSAFPILLNSLCKVFFFQTELSSSAIKFNSTKETNATEKEAVLRFLVALTGTGHYGPTSVLGYQDDLWARGLNQVKRP